MKPPFENLFSRSAEPNLTSITAPSNTTTTTTMPLKPNNDVIPIAVGATLGSIVLITLVVYAIGRWRIRQVVLTDCSAYRIHYKVVHLDFTPEIEAFYVLGVL